uniref:AP2/ERF domain-containing protein n=1 Tax=Oryza punctata TaxID=4537 RepID=A0A0E0MPD3_ORYPU
MCGRRPDNHHAVAVAAVLQAPSVLAMAHGRRPGKEEEEDHREFEEEFLRFSIMEDEEDDDDDDEVITVSPPRQPPAIGGKGKNVRLRNPVPVAPPETGGDGTKAKRRAGGGGGQKRPAAKKARSKHGFHGVHRRTYGRWAAEIRDNVIKGARTRRSRTVRRGDHGPATPPPLLPVVVADGIIDLLAGEPPAPAGGAVEFISLGTAAALDITDGWEFEPFIQELILLGGGVAPLDYYYGNGQGHVVGGGDLWSF